MANKKKTPKKPAVKPKPKSSNRRKKNQKRTTILGKPVHRHNPQGMYLSWRSSKNVIFLTKQYTSLGDHHLKAFRKSLTSKRVRRAFRVCTSPYLDLTKKPSEVRMGKGRGTKISHTIFPLYPGQILFEARAASLQSQRRIIKMFSVAGRKLPFNFTCS